MSSAMCTLNRSSQEFPETIQTKQVFHFAANTQTHTHTTSYFEYVPQKF